ncbi:MAG TPA: redoxin domain-containing protein [Candidatus Polarisedimenticolia bacterium]|nr:redoxin domain-containing protein [Candidatus Polarisedimenticolia bacterium]
MKWITLPLLWMTFTASVVAGRPATPNATCEPSPAIRKALQEANGEDDGTLRPTQLFEQRLARLRALRAKHPDDLFVHLRYQSLSKAAPGANLEPLIAEYKERLESRPEDPSSRFLLASVLVGRDTEKAMELLDQVVRQKPDLARAHFELVRIAQMPSHGDKAKALAHLEKYMELCPSTLDAFEVLRSVDDPALLEASARRLRAALDRAKDSDSLRYYESLWRLEFKTTPVAKHERLRSRVAADLKHLRRMKLAGESGYLRALTAGYQLTNDKKGQTWVEEQYLENLPRSRSAMMIVMDRFEREHPRPSAPGTSEEMLRYRQDLLTATEDWVRRWPDEGWLWGRRLNAVRKTDDATAEMVERTGDGLLSALARNARQMSASPPLGLQLAELYLWKSTRLERIPDLVKQSLEEAERRTAAMLESDPHPGSDDAYMAEQLRFARWYGGRILIQAYAQTSQPEKAREAMAQMRSALEREAQSEEETTLQQRATRTARRLGGGDSASTVQETAQDSAWEEKNQPLPDFTLTDLNGKSWRLSDLKGKVVFINIWAIWCGPCRQELPYLVKLYEQLRDNPGVVVLSLNVDEEVGLLGPFVEDHGITVPVIPAAAYVASIAQEMNIPRSWVVDPNGILVSEQVGFGEDGEAWRKEAAELIDRAGRTNR